MTDPTSSDARHGELVDVLTNLRANRDGNLQPRDYYRRWAEVEADAVLPVVAAVAQQARDEALAPVLALAEEWETAAAKPMPERAPSESAQDQGVRIGVWHSVKIAAQDLRAAIADPDALARIQAEALEDSKAVRRLREAAERRGGERERERLTAAVRSAIDAHHIEGHVATYHIEAALDAPRGGASDG